MNNNLQSRQLSVAMDAGCQFCRPSRRQLLGGMVAAAAGALLPVGSVLAAQAASRGLIDVHRHIIAPRLRAAALAQGLAVGPLVNDTTQKLLADMDQARVDKSILTQMTPPPQFTSTAVERAAFARDANETLAKLVADNARRFGFFAELPLPEVDTALAELGYALDTLKADGVQLHTSYGDKWLGDPEFAPLYAELNRRKVIVYTHPLEAACCRPDVGDVAPTTIEFGADTARAIARYLFSGSAARYPDIKVVFSHAGGVLTGVLQRFSLQAAMPQLKERLPNGLDHELQRFYFDTAQAYHAATLRGLRTAVPVSQILFGTDYPYRSSAETYAGISSTAVFSRAELRAVGSGNARRMLGYV